MYAITQYVKWPGSGVVSGQTSKRVDIAADGRVCRWAGVEDSRESSTEMREPYQVAKDRFRQSVLPNRSEM